ncbi:GNAT family N-acetyltransferase [Nitrincola sp. MINF-07-Sa-05]|uniref:GNAT family N-acetyltransferase n=1 Tax=Nitrincola salilacus TaxID=3400273 RepID=UPI003917F456
MKVQLRKAEEADLALFTEMEQEAGTSKFIIPYRLEDHVSSYSDPRIIYLRIVADEELAGYFILAMDQDARSIEFRRVVVANKGLGIGQRAIEAMEVYCRDLLQMTRIWLDVFWHNCRGRHIYEKLGYHQFGESVLDGKKLLLYEKQL